MLSKSALMLCSPPFGRTAMIGDLKACCARSQEMAHAAPVQLDSADYGLTSSGARGLPEARSAL